MATKLSQGRFFGQAQERRQLGDLILVVAHHPAGSRLPRHTHERAYFCVNFGGSYHERYGRRSRHCQPGMLVFHPPGEAHSEEHESAVSTLNVELDASWLGRVAEVAVPLDRPAELRDATTVAAGMQLLREFRRGDGDAALAIEALTWEILATAAGPGAPAPSGRPPRWLSQARDLVEARLGRPVALHDLAAAAGVHPVYFAAMFRRFHGCSVGEYQRRRRFQLARAKLADRELPLAQIAIEAGFADQSHFTRTFKRFTGMTPRQYRTFLGFKTP
jgi:AraC family transcriptional regulator